MGRADTLAIQVHVANASGTSPTITVEVWHSNDNRNWVTHSTPVSAQSLSATPYDAIVDSGSGNLGAYIKIRVALGGTGPAAYVRIHVCGRSS